RDPRHRGGRGTRDALAASGIRIVEVEADERLAEPRAQEDARQDHRREQRVGRPVAGAGDMPRVERDRDERDRLGEHVAELVGGAGPQEALEVAEHRSPPSARASATPMPRSVHVSGSSRKSAYVHVCSTSAAKQAAIAIRGGERPAPRKSTAKADTSSTKYTDRPMRPCSAATVM